VELPGDIWFPGRPQLAKSCLQRSQGYYHFALTGQLEERVWKGPNEARDEDADSLTLAMERIHVYWVGIQYMVQ
jgi:hypothetical protein